MSAITEFMDVL